MDDVRIATEEKEKATQMQKSTIEDNYNYNCLGLISVCILRLMTRKFKYSGVKIYFSTKITTVGTFHDVDY